ncbi:MAG: hypothetical protein IKP95_08855 [Ruminococcus sp.]|nr:hypothetical protein [Ruminococcus sp.]
MDIEIYKEAIASADMAFNNDNYEGAVKWYDKALEQAPTDEYALSKAGAALISLSRFDEAFSYFQRALDANPDNGDNVFNMANAYFFSGDIPKAMEYYSQAETKKCSDDVAARIYYQMALMCTINQDYQAALVNYQKYEDADKTGTAALDKELLSEKVQLYIKVDDYDNAIKCASQWVNLAPSDFSAYMIYFNLLMAGNRFEAAKKVLDDAEKYAVKDEAGKFAADISRANFYVTAAGSDLDTAGDFEQKAYDLMSELIVSPNGAPDDKNELVLSLAELCIKMNKIDEAIDLMKMVTEKPEAAAPAAPAANADGSVDPAEIDAMLQADLTAIDSKIANGELDESIGELATVNYDENGQPVREYPEGVFDDMPKGFDPEKFGMPSPEKMAELEQAAAAANAADFKARVNFMLLSCYSAKDDFEKALEYARIVKNDKNNMYYSFFGRYAEAFAIRQLALKGQGFTKEDADRKYEQELAFFRSEMLKGNDNASYSLIFRTRMYAECGKFSKAQELAEIMPPEDSAAVLEYIEQCRSEQAKS